MPEPLFADYARRLARVFVEPGGRLIVGAYGSRSRGLAAEDIAARLIRAGLPVAGQAEGGAPPITRFAWVRV